MIGKITRLMEIISPKIKGGKQFVLILFSVMVTTIAVAVFEKYLDYKIPQIANNVVERVDEQVRHTVVEVIDSTSINYSTRIDNAIQTYPEIDIRIDNLLDRINTKLNVGKSVVAIYHDGTKTPTGYPFLKYSVTNEQIKTRKLIINPTMQVNQGIAYSRIAFYANKMHKEKGFYLKSLKELEAISQPDYYSMKIAEVKSGAMLPLVYKGVPKGFLIVLSYDQEIDLFKHKDYLELIAELIMQEVAIKYGYDN